MNKNSIEAENLIVNGGMITQLVQIDAKKEKWVFEGNDPQIKIEFEKDIMGVRIEYELGKASFCESFATLYYRAVDEEFTENRTCRVILKSDNNNTRDIFFAKKVREIRFDPTDFQGECNMKRIKFEPVDVDRERCLAENFCRGNDGNNIIIVTHDLSASGAPLLAYHIASYLHRQGNNIVVMTGSIQEEFLLKRYEQSGIKLVSLKEPEYNKFNFIEIDSDDKSKDKLEAEFMALMLRAARCSGYSTIITNTIVSGEYAAFFKEYNFKIISLIHEMKTTIQLYGFKQAGMDIAKFSDYVVFPNEVVKQDFLELFGHVNGECLIRPQGVYLSNEKVELSLQPLDEYEVNEKDIVVMSSGMCELRKGVDLFVDAAIVLQKRMKSNKIHFVWTGNFGDKNLEGWLKNQIERSGLKKHFHFISFIEDVTKYKSILNRANCFWAMSREDPFPSTVLEAMQNGIPVVGFTNTGGIELMLSEGRGELVDNFDISEVVEATKRILERSGGNELMMESSKKFVENLDFNEYVGFLLEYVKRESIVTPSLDIYKYGNQRHYQMLQLPEKSLKLKKRQLKRAKHNKLFNKVETEEQIVLLDTAIGSDNVGDEIIMDYCTCICNEIFPEKQLLRVPTHIYDKTSENLERYLKILCGTNLIYKQMEKSKQWALPENLYSYNNICLLGVGMQQLGIKNKMSQYSKKLLKFLLHKNYLHSVRDEETRSYLAEIGIKNVLNTGCPTMWNLTSQHCASIPKNKGRVVLTTVTDYSVDSENDRYMLNFLKNNYEKVYIWIQGQKDYEYLKTIVDIQEYTLVEPSLEKLDIVLEQEDLDYIGTRLHAGIRSLNHGRRSIIISIDNRAVAIARDTGLFILEREKLKHELEGVIYDNLETKIRLPINAIEKWKSQFYR